MQTESVLQTPGDKGEGQEEAEEGEGEAQPGLAADATP